MARANFVKKARKDVAGTDIKKGESYWWWQFAYSPKSYSKEAPKQSQLTRSAFKVQMYDIGDRISAVGTECDDFEGEVSDIVDELQGLRDECEEKLQNMPEQLQESNSGEILQGRMDSLEEMISELEEIDCSIDTDKEEGETEEEYQDRIEERKQEIVDEIQGVEYQGE